MAVTAPLIYPKQAFNFSSSGRNAAYYDLVLWLADNHGSLTGPGWTVVECDDGTNRDVPSGAPNSFDEISASNDWSTGNANTPGTGSWAVLENVDARMAAGVHFQVLIYFGDQSSGSSTTITSFTMMPFQDFTTGGGSTGGSPATVPSTAMTHDVDTNYSGMVEMNAAADEGAFILIPIEPGTNPAAIDRWTAFGECDGVPTSTDPRNYWIRRNTGFPGYHIGSATGSQYNQRVSPYDNVTILTNGRWATPNYSDGLRIDEAGILQDLGNTPVFPVGCSYQSSGHQHFQGWPRLLFASHTNLGLKGTIGAREFLFMKSNTFGTPGVAMPWDGTTAFP